MKRKIIGIFIMTLFIAVTISPVIAQVLDQQQTVVDDKTWLQGGEWQQFVPRGKTHYYIEVHIGCYYGGSNPVTLSVEKPLGNVIASQIKPAAAIPLNAMGWVRFYINKTLDVGELYYLVLNFAPGSEYTWSYGTGDPYPSGISSLGPNEDYCFRTFVDKSKDLSESKNSQNSPFGIILAFGLDVDVKIVQLEPGEDYVDLEVLDQPFYIWHNELETINPGAFIRLYSAKGLFLPSIPICFGICDDWGIIG
jgi:hypothetical protein